MTPRTLSLAAAAAALVACSSSSGKLAVSAGVQPVASAGGPASGALALGDGVTVDRVRIVVRKIELEGSSATAPPAAPPATPPTGMDRGEDDGDEDEIQVGPFLVDLAGAQLGSGLHRVFDAEVPAGTYREISIDVRPVTAEKTGGNPAFDALVAAGASVVVDGTIDGRAFAFTSALRARQKRESTVVVGAGSSNVTLSIDPAGWFRSGTARLDPAAAADKAAIEANIAASIAIFGDDDEDGEDDDGRGGKDGPGHD